MDTISDPHLLGHFKSIIDLDAAQAARRGGGLGFKIPDGAIVMGVPVRALLRQLPASGSPRRWTFQ
jgi:hypothetical protein